MLAFFAGELADSCKTYQYVNHRLYHWHGAKEKVYHIEVLAEEIAKADEAPVKCTNDD